jgi:hypothetical protein
MARIFLSVVWTPSANQCDILDRTHVETDHFHFLSGPPNQLISATQSVFKSATKMKTRQAHMRDTIAI